MSFCWSVPLPATLLPRKHSLEHVRTVREQLDAVPLWILAGCYRHGWSLSMSEVLAPRVTNPPTPRAQCCSPEGRPQHSAMTSRSPPAESSPRSGFPRHPRGMILGWFPPRVVKKNPVTLHTLERGSSLVDIEQLPSGWIGLVWRLGNGLPV